MLMPTSCLLPHYQLINIPLTFCIKKAAVATDSINEGANVSYAIIQQPLNYKLLSHH